MRLIRVERRGQRHVTEVILSSQKPWRVFPVRNPWLDLPHQAPFVLTEDAKAVADFNRSATDATRSHVELLPEPFLGDPKAPVVLLSLNPGFSHEDADCHTDPTFARLSRANLEHRACDHPFYLLNPTVSGPGRRWWDRRLSRLLDLEI